MTFDKQSNERRTRVELKSNYSCNRRTSCNVRGQINIGSSATLAAAHRKRITTVHTLDIAPLRSETPPQKRSGMARVLKGSHSFTCTHPHVHPQSKWAISAFPFPAIAGTHLPTPEGWKA